MEYIFMDQEPAEPEIKKTRITGIFKIKKPSQVVRAIEAGE